MICGRDPFWEGWRHNIKGVPRLTPRNARGLIASVSSVDPCQGLAVPRVPWQGSAAAVPGSGEDRVENAVGTMGDDSLADGAVEVDDASGSLTVTEKVSEMSTGKRRWLPPRIKTALEELVRERGEGGTRQRGRQG